MIRRFPPLSERSGWSTVRDGIRRGGVLAVPLEYSWCLAQSPLSEAFLERQESTAVSASLIHRIKKRSPAKPFLYLAGSLDQISPFASIPTGLWSRSWIASWPSFLTLILPATPLSVSLGMAKGGGVAFRIPNDPVLRDFLLFLNTPVTGTSLNLSGEPPLSSMEAIDEVFPDLSGIVTSTDKKAERISPIIDLSKGLPSVKRPSQGLVPLRDLRYRKR